jgi:hypothetical protein
MRCIFPGILLSYVSIRERERERETRHLRKRGEKAKDDDQGSPV